ncbi:hypothetical protein YC2023_008143 [Brassica napus]
MVVKVDVPPEWICYDCTEDRDGVPEGEETSSMERRVESSIDFFKMEERTLSQEQPDLLSTNLNIDLNADPNNIDLNADPNRDMNEEPSSRKRKIGPSDDLSKANHNTTHICKICFYEPKLTEEASSQADLLSRRSRPRIGLDLNKEPNPDFDEDPNRDMNEEPSSRKRKIGPSDDLSKANQNTTNICKYLTEEASSQADLLNRRSRPRMGLDLNKEPNPDFDEDPNIGLMLPFFPLSDIRKIHYLKANIDKSKFHLKMCSSHGDFLHESCTPLSIMGRKHESMRHKCGSALHILYKSHMT